MKRRTAIVGLLALALCGCNDKLPKGPVVDAITPNTVALGSGVDVEISGRFSLGVDVDYGDADDAAAIRSLFVAHLEGNPLDAVLYIDHSRLTATVPVLAAGIYDLTVVDPEGRSATLFGAFGVGAQPSNCIQVAPGGITLEEAIQTANTQPGHDCIEFAASMTITLTAPLPALTDDAGVLINGAGNVTIDGGGSVGTMFTTEIASSNNELRGLTLTDFSTTAIRTNDADPFTVVGCTIRDSDAGIRINGGQAFLYGNLAFDNNGDGFRFEGGAGHEVIHNTLYNNSESGLRLEDAVSGVVFVNNIVAENGGFGIRDGGGDNLATVDYSLFFNNIDENCENCTPGPNSLFVDPQLAPDYSPLTGSPVIDNGQDTGRDVNGNGPGLYNGTAPDMGAVESP